VDVVVEVDAAGFELGEGGFDVAGQATSERVGEVDVYQGRETGMGEESGEEGTGGTDPRHSLAVLLGAGGLADEEERIAGMGGGVDVEVVGPTGGDAGRTGRRVERTSGTVGMRRK